MSTVLTEARHPGEFILSELSGHGSRDNITVASGSGKLQPGTVVGKVTASGKFAPTDLAASDGSEDGAAVLIYGVDATSADAKVAAITRSAEVNGKCLVYHASVDQTAEKTAKAAELAALGIMVR